MALAPFTRRYKSEVLLYDLDFIGFQTYIRLRRYKNEEGEFIINLPQLILQRIVEIDCSVPARGFNPRQVIVCITNFQNEQGFSEFTIFIPYRPIDDNHKATIKELLESDLVESGYYLGESHPQNVIPFFE